MAELLLTTLEARVIASLSEKSITTPQYYPMTVNAIMLAANQKSSRDPVMQLKEGEVGAALLDLAGKGLAQRDDAGSRVPKWRQSFQHHLLLQPHTFAVLVTLMLRGPQTQAELRSNAAALGGPSTAEGVAAALKDLADRAQPLVVLLPRGSGQKEARHAHTLSGPPELPAAPEPVAWVETPSGLAALEERIRALEERVAQLEAKNPSP
ncbi:MAG: YceH family protein [Gammaproteobacteria bacterium]